MKNQNIGEWAEFYAFLSLLCQDIIQVVHNTHTPAQLNVKSVCRSNREYLKAYNEVQVASLCSCSQSSILEHKSELWNLIESHQKGGFNSTKLQTFARNKLLTTCKPTSSHFRADLIAQFSQFPSENFQLSIKSWIRGKPTIVNASKSTTRINLIVQGHSHKNITHFQGTSPAETLYNLITQGSSLVDITYPTNSNLLTNLSTIHPNGPSIFAHMLIAYFYGKKVNQAQNFHHHSSKLTNLLTNRECLIPFSALTPSYNEIQEFIQRFTPLCLSQSITQPLDSHNRTNSILAVLRSGKIIAYLGAECLNAHFSDLIYFDTPSTTRHAYGSLTYDPDTQQYHLPLNFQLRLAEPTILL